MNSWRPALRSGSSDPIRELFGVDTTAELKCTESDETFTESASDLMIKCNINSEVNHLSEGIKLALVADREKTSEALGRLAVWQGASKVARLPPYLTVQSMRFYYKAATQSRAKIMRKVRVMSFHPPSICATYTVCGVAWPSHADDVRMAGVILKLTSLRLFVSERFRASPPIQTSAAMADAPMLPSR